MQFEDYKPIFAEIMKDDMTVYQNQYDIWQLLCDMNEQISFEDTAVREYAMKISKYAHEMSAYMASQTGNGDFDELYWRLLLLEAQNKRIDSYLLYLEKNRDADKRFYEPRREQFLRFGIPQGMQDLVDDNIDLLTISMAPGTGKSTAGIYFLSGCMGWWPDMPNLASAHSGILTRSFYDGVNQILTDTFDYTWHEIFPSVKFDPKSGTNSKEQTINVGSPKRFKSLTCRAINASLTGATRCEKILYADDLCSGIEEALSRERLDKLWQTYNTDLKTRKKDQCKEIHIQTRWSTADVVGRLQAEHENDPRARFIAIPCFDENGESNFNYKYGVGFSKEYYEDMQRSMDDISFRCLYMNQPIEREGLLYHEDDIKRYMELPLYKPDAVLSIADTKNKGTDFFFQPVLLQYGDFYYLTDCVCSDESDYEIQYQNSTNLIMRNKVEAAHYESNNGGDRVSFEVNKRLKNAGYYCNITQEYTTSNKETKIIIYAPWVKEHIYFKDKSLYGTKDDYGRMMGQLLSYTTAGKNKHDDVCDGLASFAKRQGAPKPMPTRIIKSPI